MTKKLKGLKLAGAIIETVLGIPFFGAMIIIGELWTPLMMALVFHIVALILFINAKSNKTPAIMGIVANFFGWIPFIGIILHIIAAVLYWIEWSS